AKARAKKAASLSPEVAALYREARTLREGGNVSPARIGKLAEAVKAHPEEWLLKAEVDELQRMARA
ncbi:MAG TPA: phenylalanine 4-monooxygenase, partial [Aggregicoccus sp.]|nr:phenylalanine 4-monooxygenase [Aggregicoccus sp.]